MQQLRLLEQALASCGNAGRSTFWKLLIFSCSFENSFFFLNEDNSASCFVGNNSKRKSVCLKCCIIPRCYAAPFSCLILWDGIFSSV